MTASTLRYFAVVSPHAAHDTPQQPGPDSASATSVLEREETEQDDGDADRYAHYVRRDRMEKAMKTGRPVVALCGKVWMPRRDPSKYPVCPKCKEILETLNT